MYLPEIYGFPLLSYHASLSHFSGHTINLCFSIPYLSPLSSQLISSSSVVFLSILLEVANHSFHTYKSYVQSRAGWLCELCYTWGFLLLFPIYFSRVLFFFYHLSYFCYAWFSAPLLQEILWLSLEKTDFMRGCLPEDHVPGTYKCASLSPLSLFPPLTFSFSFSLSASLLFFLALRSQYWNDSVIWIISWATLIYFFSQHTLHEISVIARTSSRICQKSFDIFL